MTNNALIHDTSIHIVVAILKYEYDNVFLNYHLQVMHNLQMQEKIN